MEKLLKKYRYLLILTLLLVFNICVIINNRNYYFMSRKVVVTNNQEKKLEYTSKKQYKIKAYYPDIKYPLLDKVITDKINQSVDNSVFNESVSVTLQNIDEFKDNVIDVPVKQNQYYTFYLLYDMYSYQDFISYVFSIETYTGGAHPNHDIFTVTYDKSTDKIVTIADLVETNPNFLDTASNTAREELINNPGIVDINMLNSGTTAEVDNFSRFAFSSDGIVFFFTQYQIAPYSSGTFEITVPYSKILPSNSIKEQE